MDLHGKVAIVTGASRGIGRGAALGLGEYGATVYVTGRTEDGGALPDFLKETGILRTASEVTALGGVGIAHRLDHANDNEVEKLFERVMDEQGRVDILVNSAWGGGVHAMQPYFFNTPFWEQPVSLWDDNFSVGLRSNYVASRLAARCMVPQKSGLIVNISYYGGRHYFNNVAYGVCKAGVDRLSEDTARELKPHGIPVFSLYPGTASTEGMVAWARFDPSVDLAAMETPRFTGRCVAALALDPDAIKESGSVKITAEVAEQYGFTDVNGNQPRSQRPELWAAR